MDQTGRLYKIDQLLRQHKVISFAALQTALGISRATLKRDLDDLRTRLKLCPSNGAVQQVATGWHRPGGRPPSPMDFQACGFHLMKFMPC